MPPVRCRPEQGIAIFLALTLRELIWRDRRTLPILTDYSTFYHQAIVAYLAVLSAVPAERGNVPGKTQPPTPPDLRWANSVVALALRRKGNSLNGSSLAHLSHYCKSVLQNEWNSEVCASTWAIDYNKVHIKPQKGELRCISSDCQSVCL